MHDETLKMEKLHPYPKVWYFRGKLDIERVKKERQKEDTKILG
jgi:hypothetical protein